MKKIEGEEKKKEEIEGYCSLPEDISQRDDI